MTGSFVVPPQSDDHAGAGGRPQAAPARGPPTPERLRVLLVEDDDADAFLVGELLDEADAAVDLVVATSLARGPAR